MEFDPNLIDHGEDDARLAGLRHLYRNKFQTMMSLVGLFGRKAPSEDCRRAFEDLRARFEALAFVSPDETGQSTQLVDLGDIASRVFSIVDPGGLHHLDVRAGVLSMRSARGSALAQILAELVIDLRRTGLSDAQPGAASVEVEAADDGGIRIIAACESGPQVEPAEDAELGRSLAQSNVRNLGGTMSRATSGPFSCEVAIPAEEARR